MANIIKLKRSSTAGVVPTTAALADGEVAINTADKKIYARAGASVIEVASGDAPATLADYAALRAYSGGKSIAQVTSQKVAGVFVYDAADTTSTDNGWTVIVGADNRRWKRRFNGAVKAGYAGAIPDNSDSTSKLQALISDGKAKRLESGQYTITSPLSIDYKTKAVDFPARPTDRYDFRGDGMSNTIINANVSGDYCLKLLGPDASSLTQLFSGLDHISDFSVMNFASTGKGAYISNKAHTRIENMILRGFSNDAAMTFDGVLCAQVDNLKLMDSKIGLQALGASNASEPNANTFTNLLLGGNSQWGGKFYLGGAGNVFNALDCENNGAQGSSSTGGIDIATDSLNGSCVAVFNNPYFEHNAGFADLSITHTGTRPLTVVIVGGNFHRTSSSFFTTYNILVNSTNGGKVRVVMIGTTFQAAGDYVSAASRPVWYTTTPSLVSFEPIGVVSNDTAYPMLGKSTVTALKVDAAGVLQFGFEGITVTKGGTGYYTVTHPTGFAFDLNGYSVTANALADKTVANIQSKSATAFTVNTFKNGADVDAPFELIIARLDQR